MLDNLAYKQTPLTPPKSSLFSPTNASCIIGNALEWYDFVIYGFFAETIGKLFFPASDSIAGVIMSLGVFAVGLLARPLGALIFGNIGDKISRKKALLLSIYAMAFPTVLIGCLPTYDQIGLLAPLALIVLRIVQGIAIGGGFTSSMVFLIEHAADNERGKIGSLASFSLVVGVLAGSFVSTILSYVLTSGQLETWGWRLPFIISIFGTFLGLYMRDHLHDPAIYTKSQAKTKVVISLKDLLQIYGRKLGVVILLDFLTAIGFFLFVIFLPLYYKLYLKFPLYVSQTIHMVNLVVFSLATILGGALSDKYGRKKILGYSSLFFAVFSYVLFLLFEESNYLSAFCIEFIMAIVLGLFFGPLPVALAEIFPTPVRLTAVSIGHNVSMAIFGGTAPMLATYIMQKTGQLASPGYLFMLAGTLTLASIPFLRDLTGKPLE